MNNVIKISLSLISTKSFELIIANLWQRIAIFYPQLAYYVTRARTNRRDRNPL